MKKSIDIAGTSWKVKFRKRGMVYQDDEGKSHECEGLCVFDRNEIWINARFKNNPDKAHQVMVHEFYHAVKYTLNEHEQNDEKYEASHDARSHLLHQFIKQNPFD